ncbi:NADH-ubiquinone oxidoreductase-F iron-sulfur binding region domain-containing protein [Salinisphaera sp. LB1]|uniref:NADH-ubiquinone oxidoreductase-F iron-sulfur binding region domain-containing protein n=1 Tax=Salinisphaera sp. LB1 TaxID=2183911 RepID=UPI000D7072A4|nr:NADH-ubiquinone oxidoreductase-F iron-sulfur binding region domain-containing protein [Salinisphaera sp. LB1]AWN15916.1 NAD-dependent formate dehydrogenase beta subunit [Salinisphaera sp. LB1]
MKYYISKDSAAVSIGAAETAVALEHAAPEATIVRTGSRGLYWLEPLIEVEQNGHRLGFGPIAANEVASVVEAVENGRMTEHPRYVDDIDTLLRSQGQRRVTFARCGVIDPTDWDDFVAHGGSAGLRAALENTGQAIVDAVKESGLRGRGGAGFPTGIKWQTVHDTPETPKYIVCNADEGDSGTFADRMIMEGDPLTLLEGMAISAAAVGATRGYIYLRSEYPDAERTLKRAIEVARDNGMLGEDVLGSGRAFDVELRMGAGAYICGEETSLLESLEGKRGMVRFKPPLPAVKGFLGQPTVINNVITLSTVPAIMAHGAPSYHGFGINKSRGTLTIQLCGNVARPGLYELPFGATVDHVINTLGGGSASGRPVRAVQVGGPLGAYLPSAGFDTSLGYEEMAEKNSMIGHGGMVVFDDTVDMAQQARFAMEFCDLESCGKCTPCRVGSVRAQEVIDRIIADDERETNLDLLRELCDTMINGSLCAHGGMAPYPVLSALNHFPEDFGAREPAEVQ